MPVSFTIEDRNVKYVELDLIEFVLVLYKLCFLNLIVSLFVIISFLFIVSVLDNH